MLPTKAIFVALFCAVAQLGSAATPHLNRRHVDISSLKTNAARMAAGLTPLPPRGLETRTWPNHGGGGGGGPGGPGFPGHGGPGNGGHPGNPGWPPVPQPSPKPPGKPDRDDKKQVRIKCKKKNGGGHVGWVGKDFSSRDKNKRGFGLCSKRERALEVDFENSVTPFDVKIPSRSDFPFLGWVGNNLGGGNSCILTGTKKTNINNSPSNVGNAFSSWAANSESQIWYFTRSSKRFDAKWVNSGGIRTESRTFYDPEADLFHLVTDTNQFLRRNPRAYEVEFEMDE